MKNPTASFVALGLTVFGCAAFVSQAAFNEVRPSTPSAADRTNSVSAAERNVYNDHLTILASPYMEGRVPGSAGMERAMDYVEYYFRQYGLEPAFPTSTRAADGSEVITPRSSYRQPFPLGGSDKATVQKLSFDVGGKTLILEPGKDFSVTGLGPSGQVSGPMVFVGYSIKEGPDGYQSFDNDDLSGKIALVFRFEPVNDEGNSRWATGRGWSPRANFASKMQAIKEHNPAGVIIINPPGTSDPRAGQLTDVESSGGRVLDVPVLMMTTEAGERLVAAADPQKRSLVDLRRLADDGRIIADLTGTASLEARIEREQTMAQNVGALLPGRGPLADEFIVIGAHLDHLGMGYFGSRSGPGELHPGADDNASGSAGILLLSDKLKRAYDALPTDASARSILFIAFSGEESGLHGSRFYANNPIVPIDDHALMINFDMIGRIKDNRLSVSGYSSGEGMKEWLQPFFADTPLTVVQSDQLNGASDHSSFLAKQIPVLFGIIADFHADYHTPRDTSDQINREGAVMTIDLFEKIAFAAAQRPERFSFSSPQREPRRQAARSEIKVRFGIMPGYSEEGEGVLIEDVTAGGSAAEGGVKPGDRLIRWDGQKIADIQAWMEMLKKHNPGDKIKIGVLRDGEEVTLDVTLQGT
ncbi:MAG: M28 family peptidase [Phycisphaerales bacterium]|nr:M28 family peptidase [Phycisphaerales bacterium]